MYLAKTRNAMRSALRCDRVKASDNDLLGLWLSIKVFNTHASDVDLDQVSAARKQSQSGKTKARGCFVKKKQERSIVTLIAMIVRGAGCWALISPPIIYIQRTPHQSLLLPPHFTMSHRHLSRQPDRDLHPHQLIHHTPNGAPVVPPTAPNVTTQPPSIIHKLNTANEQTWLLIGTFIKRKKPHPCLRSDSPYRTRGRTNGRS